VEEDDEAKQVEEEIKPTVLVIAVNNQHDYMRNNCIIRWN